MTQGTPGPGLTLLLGLGTQTWHHERKCPSHLPGSNRCGPSSQGLVDAFFLPNSARGSVQTCLGPLHRGGKAALASAGLLHRLTWIWFEPAHPHSSGCLSFFRLPSVHSGPGHHTHHPEGHRHPLVTVEVMACCQGQASHPPWSLPSAKHFQGTSTASSLLILPCPWGVGSTAVRRER